ncbi:MAG: 7-carboxy-7-deazaguanine synthase QueE [Gemmataceae bacterium]|nr:7-carboxy-7-deazaguanine synthase QueE [Gemmataceae bacterium]
MAVLQQRLKPLEAKPAGALLLHEIYRSVQGESAFAGLPCVFVRTAVCDLRCVWCDTPHAFTQGSVWTLDDVLATVASLQTRLVEVTGGEPLVQSEVLPLLSRLADAGHTVLLETSGGRAVAAVDRRVHIIMDLKCPDSGESDANLWENLEHLKPTDEIKFVIASKRDFEWTVETIHGGLLDKRFQVLVSPAFGLVQPVELANWLLTSGLEVRLQLQLHKYIWDPTARGV